MDSWIPFFQALIWPVFIALLILAFRGWFRQLLEVIRKRIEGGSEMSVGPGGFTLGQAPKMEEAGAASSPAPEAISRFAEQSKSAPTAGEASQDLSKYFQLVHSAKYDPAMSRSRGQPYYTIQVRLEAEAPGLLERVTKVVYHLHPTFPNPDREVSTPANGFELTTQAWGQFNLSADVYFDGNPTPLRLFRYLNF